MAPILLGVAKDAESSRGPLEPLWICAGFNFEVVRVVPDNLVNLRLTSKQMLRGAKKCEQAEKDAKAKLKKAIKDQNTEGARIYAQVSRHHELSTAAVDTRSGNTMTHKSSQEQYLDGT